jgi:hypothetical protein
MQTNYEWITYSRVRVLRELAAFRTEREIAANLGITYDGIRSVVEDVKRYTGLGTVREIGRWWLEEAPLWMEWAAKLGSNRRRSRRRRRRVREVGDWGTDRGGTSCPC